MDFTLTFDHVHDQVASDDRHKWDVTVHKQAIVMRNGRIQFPETYALDRHSTLVPTRWATGQFCQALGIPTQYFCKCPASLQDAQFNHWVSELYDPEADPEDAPDCWLLRAQGITLRGVLSERYAPLDNADLLQRLKPLIEARFQVGLFVLTAESMHIRLIDQRLAREVLKNDTLFVGVHVSNSEVGKRAVTVDALVWRLVCTNGLIRKIAGRSLLHQRHVSIDHPRFEAALTGAVEEAVTVATGFIEQLSWSTRQPVKDVEAAIDSLSRQWGLTQATVEQVRFALLAERPGQQETLYGLINAVTNAAQRLPVDDRYALETLAGRLLDSGGVPEALRVMRPTPLREAA